MVYFSIYDNIFTYNYSLLILLQYHVPAKDTIYMCRWFTSSLPKKHHMIKVIFKLVKNSIG